VKVNLPSVLLERKFLSPGAKVFNTNILDQGRRISSVQARVLAESAEDRA
jgi:hypothetical protein